jgi:hypothetical protein
MVDTCPICHESLAHKLIAYVQELGSLSHCGSDVSPRKYAVTPRMSDKLASSVRNGGLGHTMQAHDASNIQLHVLFSPVVGVHRNEMSKLGELVDDHPYGVKLVGRERQSDSRMSLDLLRGMG